MQKTMKATFAAAFAVLAMVAALAIAGTATPAYASGNTTVTTPQASVTVDLGKTATLEAEATTQVAKLDNAIPVWAYDETVVALSEETYVPDTLSAAISAKVKGLKAGTTTVVMTLKNVNTGETVGAVTYTVTVKPTKKDSTITLAGLTKTYNGKSASVYGTAKVTGSTGKVTYVYYTDAACTAKTTTAAAGGKAAKTGYAPVYPGTYYCKATVAADSNFNGASTVATITIKKIASTITLSGLTKTYNKKAASVYGKAKVTGSTGKVTYAYYTDSACTQKTAHTSAGGYSAKTGYAPVYSGTYYCKATVAGDATHSGKSAVAKIVIKKAPQNISIANKTIYRSSVAKKSITWTLGIKTTAGKYTSATAVKAQNKTKTGWHAQKTLTPFKVSGGKATMYKHSCKKATLGHRIYVKVTSPATRNYAQTTKTVCCTVTMK